MMYSSNSTIAMASQESWHFLYQQRLIHRFSPPPKRPAGQGLTFWILCQIFTGNAGPGKMTIFALNCLNWNFCFDFFISWTQASLRGCLLALKKPSWRRARVRADEELVDAMALRVQSLARTGVICNWCYTDYHWEFWGYSPSRHFLQLLFAQLYEFFPWFLFHSI